MQNIEFAVKIKTAARNFCFKLGAVFLLQTPLIVINLNYEKGYNQN